MITETDKVVTENGTFYFKKGTKIRHNDVGPAIIWKNGTKKWIYEGKYLARKEVFKKAGHGFFKRMWLTVKNWFGGK